MRHTVTRASSPSQGKGRDLLINLTLFIVAAFFALILAELTLRLIGRGPLYVSPERDRFWKYDLVLGWAHEPGQIGTFATAQFSTTVHINQKGLRDRDHEYDRKPDTKRILVLGDSFAWGYGVEEAQRFSQLLESTMNVEVINAGVSGYSTDQELLWYQDEGIKYDVDLVILVMAGNDIGDISRQLVSTIYYKPRFVLEDGLLVLLGSPVPKTRPLGRLVYSLSQHSALAHLLVQRYFSLVTVYSNLKGGVASAKPPADPTGAATQPFELTLALLNEMRSIATSRKASFMIVATDHWWNGSADQTYDGLLVAMQRDGFSVLSIEAMPGFEPTAMLIPDDGHWNAAGHAFVAEKIKQFIEADPQFVQLKPHGQRDRAARLVVRGADASKLGGWRI